MNEVLPIFQYRDEIIAAVRNNRVVIIKAETGAGKSTQVPQFLLECFQRVVVTQPRRLATIGITERVALEMKCEVGGLVGYRTSMDGKDSEETRLLFCTDGLELVSELFGKNIDNEVLVIDEVHEWNLNIETLVAWAQYKIMRGSPYKVVIMSATIEPEELLSYFGCGVAINVPGRTFPVTERRSGKSIVEETLRLLKLGRNVLVFQPGKADIRRTIRGLEEAGANAEIFPLHADMSHEEQLPCFLSYRRPKCIVSTNVAEVSLTIPGVDAVVDSGIERRVEYVDGVEGLYLRTISLASRDQRKGRAGRTKPGTYIDTCPTPLAARSKYPTADILRLPIDETLLRLALVGIDLEDFQFFHQPSDDQIQKARERLFCLGCLDRWGALTPIGKRVAKLPISVRWARMLIEASERNVLPDVITLVSIMEQGRITNGKGDGWKKSEVQISVSSDAFTQLAAYEAAVIMQSDQLEANGIDPKALTDAQEIRNRLYALPRETLFNKRSTGREKDILRSIYAGLADCLFKKSVIRGYKDRDGNIRNLPVDSVAEGAEWVIGLPWNLQIRSDFGPKTLRLITMATRVDPVLLKEVAPHLVAEEEKPSGDKAVRRARIIKMSFNGMFLVEEHKRVH